MKGDIFSSRVTFSDIGLVLGRCAWVTFNRIGYVIGAREVRFLP